MFTDTVPSDLAGLWNAKSAQQKGVIRLCAAVRAADDKQLKVHRCCHCLQSAPSFCPHRLLGSAALCGRCLCLIIGTPMLRNADQAACVCLAFQRRYDEQ